VPKANEAEAEARRFTGGATRFASLIVPPVKKPAKRGSYPRKSAVGRSPGDVKMKTMSLTQPESEDGVASKSVE